MRYYASVRPPGADTPSEHEIVIGEEGVLLDGEAVSPELAALAGSPVRHLRIGDRGFAFLVQRTEDGWDIEIGGRHWSVGVESERARAIRELSGAPAPGAGPRALRAPMPGLIVRVEVEEGEAVEAGAGLIVMEAMKMENELRAEAAGHVAHVAVREGETVNQGDVLVRIE